MGDCIHLSVRFSAHEIFKSLGTGLEGIVPGGSLALNMFAQVPRTLIFILVIFTVHKFANAAKSCTEAGGA